MEVSFNGAEGATVELMRRWLNAIDQSDGLGLVPLRTYGILCKSKDDTLFPLLCCNAGALTSPPYFPATAKATAVNASWNCPTT